MVTSGKARCPYPKRKSRLPVVLGGGLRPAALGGRLRETLVDVVEVFLQPFLDLFFERGELDSHSHGRVTGTHASLGKELVRVDPECNVHDGIHCERDQSLYIAPAATNVGGRALHVRALCIGKADHNWELNSVPQETTFVRPSGELWSVFSPARKFVPRNFLSGKNSYSGLKPLWQGTTLDPLNFKPSLLVPVLYPKDFACLQRVLDSAEERTFVAQVGSGSVLEERLTISVHA